MDCRECQRLLDEYELMESRYAALALQFVRLHAAADEAKENCETALRELELHRMLHAKAN